MSDRARVLVMLGVAGALLWSLGPIGRLIVAGCVVLFAPGFLLWQLLAPDLHLPRFAAPTLWLCLSLSIVPLVFLWSSTLGLRLSPVVLRMQALGVALLSAWFWHRTPAQKFAPRWLLISLVLVLGLVGLTRILEIRAVTLPPWVDSLHHTLLVRIISETGRIPTSLEPYMPVPQLIYHWGYHTTIAAWRGIADLPVASAVLWSGQVLNAAIALVLYALGAYVLRSPRAGVLAAGVGGLLSIMPAYYVTWGRYTQLTGLLLLPGLLITSMALAERPRFSWRLAVVTAILLAGLMLVHYRVLVFYAAFMAPFALLLLARRRRLLGALVARFAIVGGLAALLTLPWVIVLLRRILIPVAQAPAALVGGDSYNTIDWNLLFAGNARILYALAAFGCLLALRRWRVPAMAGWIGTMFLIANPQVLGLSPSWLINNHSVMITIFMPVAVLVAAGIHITLQLIERRFPAAQTLPARALIGAVFLAAALWGTWQLRDVINAQTVLALPEDVQAIEWAAANTPPDARFLVNATYWLNGAYRGADAGWWLLPLAGRWVTTPPALYIYGGAEYKQRVEALNQRISTLKPNDEAGLMQLLRDARITHIFIGKKQSGPLRLDVLLSNPAFTPIYDQQGVTILAVAQTP